MYMRIPTAFSMIVLAGLLGACGGGNSEIRLTPATMDTYLNSNAVYIRASGETVHVPYICFADICDRDTRSRAVASYTAENLEFLGIHQPPEDEVLRRNGFNMAHWAKEESDYRFFGFGAWGKFVAFDIGIANVFPEDRDPYQYTEATLGGVGNRTNPSPAGGASWSGVMLGMDYADSHAQQFVQSDARVTVDFEQSEVDVAFTGIIRIDGTSTYPDITWTALPMRDGRFASPSIDGRFFGGKHQEAGGVFDRDNILGAFGAARD